MSERIIGLAMSGGGARAAAFHLGCLRALHDRDLLQRVRVVSGVSGGSLLAALWAYGPKDFDRFDQSAVQLLRRGLHLAILGRALRPTAVARNLVAAASAVLSGDGLSTRQGLVRFANRTDGLAAALADAAFGAKEMADVTDKGMAVVLSATDLATGSAVRFGSENSSCSRYGTIIEPVDVATAVAASAAFPLLLPAIERTFAFDRGRERRDATLNLSDGGLYDNLGLSVLQPGRSLAFTPHVYDVDYIVSCDAGRGELQRRAPRFLPGRLSRSFDVVHRRAQDNGRARLHEWAATGRIRGFVMAYLGMRDDRLPIPLADLVPRETVARFGTNFAGMSNESIELLASRGEQLVRSLLPAYCPELA